MTALELLQNLNLLDETERIEAKRASEAGKSLLETVCAFANEPGLGGGWLLLGVPCSPATRWRACHSPTSSAPTSPPSAARPSTSRCASS
ncbi:AlbA family DNA-binding domain-containing protein [Hydrogenophaga sp. SL48]|jgi:hypothetical protein|uniref:AlbA family DNA-binding domain-containing protein n=1 Tax=Hydrogenophaga sp. SL48 TaxID=2806347 RepID=UPI001F1C381F|nr:RNA-binding domain-containing protein [Hydrogenophaga sp. SL48]